MRTIRFMLICIYFSSIVLLSAFAIGGEAISLTYPIADVEVGEGDEFATKVVGNRWDMNELRDVPLDYLYYQPTVLNGIWYGTFAQNGALMFLLNRGFSTPDYDTYPSLYDNGIPYGPLNPIDSGKYTRLSIRMGMTQGERSSILFFWQKTLGQIENNYYAFVDADFNRNSRYSYASGFRIYDIDMARDTFLNDRNPELFSVTSKVGAWDGQILGLYGILTGAGRNGTKVQVDWARLYDPLSSAVLPISWQTSGLLPCDPKYYTVQLWVDTDSQYYDGDLYVTGLLNDGRYNVYLSSLPPGDYYFYLKLILQGDNEFYTVATSHYSSRVRVSAAPSLVLDAPSMTSGDDYATVTRGSAWDMADSSGIASVYDVTNITYAGGLMSALATVTSGGSDSRLMMNLMAGAAVAKIDPARYRYLSFRMWVDPTGYGDFIDRLTRGWVTRLIWADKGTSVDGSYSKDVILLEDWHTYTIDLWDRNFLETKSGTSCPQLGWRELLSAGIFRFDPLEVFTPTIFALDYIRLHAVNTPVNNQYAIRWTASDVDTDPSRITLKLYDGQYSSAGVYSENPKPIAVIVNPVATTSCVWNTSFVENGGHYIRAEITDGLNTLSRMSSVPVIVANMVDYSKFYPVSGDYDGDGQSDLARFYSVSGGWFISALGGSVIKRNELWGWDGAEPVPGDYDGDGKDDLAVFNHISGDWYVLSPNGNVIAWARNWGWPTAEPVSGDFDGDGLSDMAVFDQATGYWYILTMDNRVLAWATPWGWPGAEPVPGDYDGDGKDDLAVFDHASPAGEWYVYSLAKSAAIIWGERWGWPGAEPVPGDYDGDGIDDMAVFDHVTGNWFIWSHASKQCLAWATVWGWPAATPVAGDFDGDGNADLGIYDEGSGTFFILSMSGRILAWAQN